MDRSGPGGPQGPQPPLVDQERSGPPWTTLRHFPDAPIEDAVGSMVPVGEYGRVKIFSFHLNHILLFA